MNSISITINAVGDPKCWPEVVEGAGEGNLTRMAVLEKGMESGDVSATFCVECQKSALLDLINKTKGDTIYVLAQASGNMVVCLGSAVNGARARFKVKQ